MSSLKDGGSRVSIAEDTYVFVDLRPQLAGDLRAARVSSRSRHRALSRWTAAPIRESELGTGTGHPVHPSVSTWVARDNQISTRARVDLESADDLEVEDGLL